MIKEYPAMHFLYCHAQKDLRRQLTHAVAGTLLAAQDEDEGRKRKQKVSMGELERGLWLNMDDRQTNDPGQLWFLLKTSQVIFAAIKFLNLNLASYRHD